MTDMIDAPTAAALGRVGDGGVGDGGVGDGGVGDGGAALRRVLGPNPPPFALLHRPGTGRRDRLSLLVGEMCQLDRLDDLPASRDAEAAAVPHDLLVLVPFRQIAERGFDCTDDGTPLQALRVLDGAAPTVAEVLRAIDDRPIVLRDAGFDIDDAAYAGLVRTVVADEIGSGVGANFVLKRSFLATVEDYSVGSALAVFGRLLRAEQGAHWTFLVHTGSRTLVGASPERHITLADGTATMNPISGTYRYPAAGVTLPDLLAFLADRKESDELYMVLDEELKMMGRICTGGGRVIGPRLRPMARLAHTEYLIEGRTTLDAREILRQTMFAPTVTGSPLESACRVISRYERAGRGYYGGVLALIGRDGAGAQTLDSTIVIRTADIDVSGRLRLDVGATLVRHSDPDSEVAETRAKAAALLAALGMTDPGRPRSSDTDTVTRGRAPEWWSHPHVRSALDRRNTTMSRFWVRPASRQPLTVAGLAGRRALVIDCEDNFTFMLAHQLRALGLAVTVRRFDERLDTGGADLVVVGPGPGDPRDVQDAKIATMRRATRRLLDDGTALLAVCLGHQVLAGMLGLDLVRRQLPNQGAQREIDFFGRRERCGFYNTFVAVSSAEEIPDPVRGGTISVARDHRSGEIHAMRGTHLCSLQFHPESVLTENGVDILREVTTSLLGTPNLSPTR